MTEKDKNPTNAPILKKFHRVEHAQFAFENASKPTFFLHAGAYHPGASISHVDPMSQRIYTLGYF